MDKKLEVLLGTLKEDERKVVDFLLSKGGHSTSKEITLSFDFSKAKVSRLVKSLWIKDIVETERDGLTLAVSLEKGLFGDLVKEKPEKVEKVEQVEKVEKKKKSDDEEDYIERVKRMAKEGSVGVIREQKEVKRESDELKEEFERVKRLFELVNDRIDKLEEVLNKRIDKLEEAVEILIGLLDGKT
jgi:TATA-binding protein-associated factor Taf7